MTSEQSLNTQHPGMAARDDVTRLLGDMTDEEILQILALEPTMLELQEAAAWIEGTGDVIDRAGRHLTPRITSILEIVDRNDDEECRLR